MEAFYQTVGNEAEAELTERRSRFIGRIQSVTSEEEALEYIQTVKKRCWDASHNVSAFILRKGNLSRSSDDGEPQGTAGSPVLEVLKKEALTDVCLTVTRYFGGVLLGAGGLVRAYSGTASLTVAAATIVRFVLCQKLQITCNYGFYQKLMRTLQDWEAVVVDSAFTEEVALTLLMPQTQLARCLAALTELSAGQVKPLLLEQVFHSF